MTQEQNQTTQTTETELMLIGLPSGEKVIANIYVDGGSVIMKDVLEIITTTDGANNYRFGLAPFMVYADPEAGISVPVTQITMAIPGAELRDAHSRKFSKIQLPESSLIIPR
jgi:hypothetical protein